ncbi:MAG: 2-amino-4-hydroxy-6-hydroxymethyldihydropteridine diphosphokinase [Candidatus Methanomethylophilaceae archaeon]|nr:2-amino-4-hydroxy-6-hydroxymethyldihydropteridine diphosphokinase [Candidatus Methanomethylophilaceae archaeon]MDI3542225.1 2-amino-4-hydroxy-6-hydroxymethyldihydropteridine diphosphokinase [Candidatus Methanomethylophilaceae archaeon]HIJ00685.1 DUF115 domain-containing protein [Candidatus Methanomethylophilaceae archaeon]
MYFEEWEPVYERIIKEMGYSRLQDEASARMLRHMILNKRLIDVDDLIPLMSGVVNVVGAAVVPEELTDIDGTVICAGSSAKTLIEANLIPEILITDLDGDLVPQAECCRRGAVAVIHAHGDNADLIQQHLHLFNGPIIATTQSRPDLLMVNMGGFTDGDRAVCMARHLGAKKIRLVGFDFERPIVSEGEDLSVKKTKLKWAKHIIFDMNPPSVEIIW